MILYGKGGHANVIREALESQAYSVDYVFDDSIQKSLNKFEGGYNALTLPINQLVIGVGNNFIRRSIAEKVRHSFGIVKHRLCYISDSAIIDEGSVVLVGAKINANTKLGKHVIVNTGAIIDHDCVIGDFVHVAPGAVLCGHVKIGDNSLIGAGAVIGVSVTIGDNVTIRPGLTILKDVPNNSQIINRDWV